MVSSDVTYVNECLGFHLMMTRLIILDAFKQALDSNQCFKKKSVTKNRKRERFKVLRLNYDGVIINLLSN